MKLPPSGRIFVIVIAVAAAALAVAWLALAGMPARAAAPCVTSAQYGSCGPYPSPSKGLPRPAPATVNNDMWGCGVNGPCGPETLTSRGPGSWQVTSDQPPLVHGNEQVLTFPDVWQPMRLPSGADPQVRSFAMLRSGWAEASPRGAGNSYEAAYDMFFTNNADGRVRELMIWVDDLGHGFPGATLLGHAAYYGQRFTVYGYPSGEVIFSMDRNTPRGTAHILSALLWMNSHRLLSLNARITSLYFGWEICSTGGRAETFTLSKFTITARCEPGTSC
jgi:hypothetical protein